jgi:hypothetical protein
MKHKLSILFILVNMLAYAQTGRYQPHTDAGKVFDTIPLTFHQKLTRYSAFAPSPVTFKAYDLDTNNCSLSFELEFIFSKKAFKMLLNDLLGDSLYEKMPVSKKLTIKSNKLTLRNAPGKDFLCTESSIDINAINGKPVNKTLPVLVLLRSIENYPALDIYMPVSDTTWYYFTYYKGIMYGVSSNEKFNYTLNNFQSSGKHYFYSICAAARRDMFLRKLKSIEEITGKQL